MRLRLPLLVLAAALPGCSGGEDHPGVIPEDLGPDGAASAGGETGAGGRRGSGGRQSAGGRGSGGRVAGGGGAASGGEGAADDSGVPDAGDAGSEAGSDGGGGAPDGGGGPCDRGTFTGNVSVFSQADLATVRGFTEVTGALYIGTNNRVQRTDVRTLEPLECLERVGGLFTILESPQLVDLTGLEQLTFVHDLRISANAGLVSLEGPIGLALDNLLIINNPALLRLTDGIAAVTTRLEIYDNPNLPQCEADGLAASVGAVCQCSGNAGAGTCN